jgi:hypothetical protein
MSSKIIAAAVALSLVLSGCSSAENQQLLANYQQACSQGSASDCEAARNQAATNQDEARSNALKAVGIALLIPLVVIAAAAQAREDEGPQCYNRWGHYWYYC